MIAAAVDLFTPDRKIHFTQQVETDPEEKKKKRILLIPAEAKLIFHKNKKNEKITIIHRKS